jgi:hypothetical protein
VRTLRKLLLIALSAWILLALGTYLAGERTEVAVLTTYDADGASYDTKMWVVDYEGRPYVRIGRPGRGWGERLKANPNVVLARDGSPEPRIAAIVTDSAQRGAIDRAFAEKYGWVDWWFGLVLRKDPAAVRLDPRPS